MAEADVQRAPARRGMYILPSLFTSGSIALGYYIIMQSIRGSMMSVANPQVAGAAFDHAAVAIAFAIVFDGLDGRIARMTNTSSAFGKELDSLADVITFGVAPSLLAYLWGVRQLTPSLHPEIEARVMHFGLVVCFLFLICGACRLARFNISVNPQPRNPGRPQIFRGNADSCGCGSDRSRGPFRRRIAGTQSLDGVVVVGARRVHWFPYGEQLAVLEWQRD